MDLFLLSELKGTADPIKATLRNRGVAMRHVPAAVKMACDAAFPMPRVPTRLCEDQGSKGTKTEADYEDPDYQKQSMAVSMKRSAALVAWALNAGVQDKDGIVPPPAGIGDANFESVAAAYFVAAAAQMLRVLTEPEIDYLYGKVRAFGLVEAAERAAKN